MKLSLLKSDSELSQIDFECDLDNSLTDYAISLLNRVYRQNTKQGTKKVKTRSEVRGKSAKPYRQKGTGNARQGSRKGPHFRGGGVSHGPTPDYHKLSLNKRFKHSVLKKILSKYITEDSLFLIDLSKDVKGLREELAKEKSLVVYSSTNRENTRSVRNLRKVDLMPASSLSPLMLLNYKRIYVDMDEKERLAKILK